MADLPGPTAAVLGAITLDELAAELAARLGPMLAPAELDDELAAWVRAAGVQMWRFQIGPPVQPCYLEARLHPDGSMSLALLDWYAQARWRYVVRPPSSTAPPAGEPNPATSGRTQPS